MFSPEEKHRLWQMVVFFGVILLTAGYLAGMAVQWLDQRAALSVMDEWEAGVKQTAFNLNPLICWSKAFLTSSGRRILFGCALVYLFIWLFIRVGKGDEKKKDERNFNISEKGTYGTSGWMTDEELDATLEHVPLDKAQGTLLGIKDGKAVALPLNSRLNKHTAIFGASGTGKSRSFVRPQILQCVARGESVIITDPKGEIYADAAEYMRVNGYEVKVFDLVDPQYSDAWNCLQEVMPDPRKMPHMSSEDIFSEMSMNAQTFCDVVIRNTSSGKSDHFWDNSELSLLKAVVLFVATGGRTFDTLPPDEIPCFGNEIPPHQRTIGEVYTMISSLSAEQLQEMISKLPAGHPAHAPFNLYIRAGATVQGNVIIGLGTRIQVFQSQMIKDITCHDEIDLELPAKKKCGYFVVMSDQNSTLDFLSSLFFSFLFIKTVRYADIYGITGRCDVPINFILDEFPNIGQIPDFTKKLSTIRSRELRVAVIFQNIAQLQNRYPLGLWEEIIGNCDTQLFLGCTDQTTAGFISDRTGEMTIEVQSSAVTRKTMALTQSIPDYKETESVGKRLVLTPDEVLRLESDQALLFIRGQKPLKVRKYDYEFHPRKNDFIHCYLKDHVPAWLAAKLARREGYVPEDTSPNLPVEEPAAELEASFDDFFADFEDKPGEEPLCSLEEEPAPKQAADNHACGEEDDGLLFDPDDA